MLNLTRQALRDASEVHQTLATNARELQEAHSATTEQVSIEQDKTRATEEIMDGALRDLSAVTERYDVLAEHHKTLRKEKERLRARDRRASDRQENAVATVQQSRREAPVYALKDLNGIVPDATRSYVQDLVGRGIAVDSVYDTIVTSASHLGVAIHGSISTRTISRIVLEGGKAAKAKLASELATTSGIQVSHPSCLVHTINFVNQLLPLVAMARLTAILNMNQSMLRLCYPVGMSLSHGHSESLLLLIIHLSSNSRAGNMIYRIFAMFEMLFRRVEVYRSCQLRALPRRSTG